MSEQQTLVDHAVSFGKVVAGGVGVGGTTYTAVSQMTIEHATALATLTAAVATTLYFSVAALYAAWKWIKEVRGKNPPS